MCVCAGTACEQPYVPVNGEFICSEEEEGVNCTLHCKDGYSFTQDAVHSYFCAYNGVWEPPYSADRPDCSGILLLPFEIFSFLLSALSYGLQHAHKYVSTHRSFGFHIWG